jgi:hypothetical protein
MRTALLALLFLLPRQDATVVEKPATRPPRKGAFAPGELSDDAKRKKFDELNGKAKKDSRAALRTAAARRKEWLEGLEKEYGVYDVATLLDNGDPSRRVNVVIVSAGFQKSEAAKVNAMAESMKAGLLKVDPFHTYPLYINFHRVNVNDAGPASARIPYRVVNSLLSCDTRKAMEIAELAPAADLVVVICNTPPCRASENGPVIAIDPGLDMGRTFLHEMGHAFGHLLDEYVEPANEKVPSPQFSAEQEESYANVTTNANPRTCKWHYWVPEVWNTAYTPNRLPPQHKISCFEGAGLYGRGAYRPETSCLMQSGDRYCVICFEQLETQFYRLIAPIDDARPRKAKLGLWIDDAVTFEGDAIQVSGAAKSIGEFRVQWYVDAKNPRPTTAKNLTTTLAVQAQDLGEGLHEVALRVDFSNSRVRRDHGWLSGSRSWRVDVSKYRRPKFEAPVEVKAQAGTPVGFEVQIENPDPAKFRLETSDFPEGSTFANGKFAWTPAKAHAGAWRPRFVLTDGLRAVTREVEISVVDPAAKENFKPLFLPMEPVAVAAGETLELPLDVVDVDGDNLVFSCSNLPEGAELDVYEGMIRWKPGASQAGRHPGIAIEVWDGTSRVKGSLDIVVEENPLLRKETGGVSAQLRSPVSKVRAEALRKLATTGRLFRLLESARLLRDRSSPVRVAALDLLRSLSDTPDEAFLGMMTKDLAPHAWSFTDEPDTLAWLGTLVAKGKGDRADLDLLRGSLKGIEKYNRDRGILR